VTPEEARTLVAARADGLRGAVGAIGDGRRALHHDAPKGAAVSTYWGRGIAIPRHD
jgi:hypothetical protein